MQPESISKEFDIPIQLAREIISDETQRALRTNWQAWTLLVAMLAIAGWLFFVVKITWLGLFVGSSGAIAWRLLGTHLAAPKIRQAAKDKGARLAALRT